MVRRGKGRHGTLLASAPHGAHPDHRITPLLLPQSGELTVYRDDGVELARMKQGEFFGESALTGTREPRKANVRASGNVEVLSISAADFELIIGSVTEALENNLNERIVDSIELLSYLSRGQRQELVVNLATHKVPAGTKLLEQVSLCVAQMRHARGRQAAAAWLPLLCLPTVDQKTGAARVAAVVTADALVAAAFTLPCSAA